MTEKEIYEKMKQLLNKTRWTKSQKLRKLYMIDFVSLQSMLQANYHDDIYEFKSNNIEDKPTCDDAIINVEDLLEELEIRSLNEFIEINDITQKLANKTINTFDKENFAPYPALKRIKYDTKLLHNALREFLNSIDSNYLEKYDKMLIEGIPIGAIDNSTAGICFNIFSENKQFIKLSSNHYIYENLASEIGFFQTLTHEFGHTIHLDKINQGGKIKYSSDAFNESMSIMFEKMYLDYLERMGIDIKNELRNEYYLFLCQAINAKIGSHAIDDRILEYDYTIPEEYFSEDYLKKYTYLLNSNSPIEKTYDTGLPYFYGELISSKFIDEFGTDYKHATKELLDILVKLESSDSKQMIKEIGLNKVPKGISRNLRKIK